MRKFCFFLLIACLSCSSSLLAASKEDKEKIKAYIQQGQSILEKDPKSAEIQFSKALSIERNETALKGLGWAYWKQRQPEKAIVIWKELSAKHPEDLRLKNQLAKLHIEQKNIPEAERTYKQVIQKDPKNVDALVGIAGIMNLNHNYDEAQSIFERLSKQAPDQAPRILKPWALSLFEGRKYQDALPKWEFVVKNNPKDTASLSYLGRTLYHLGQYDKALPILKTVTEKDPNNIKSLETQLLYAKFKKDQQESKRLLLLLIDASPQNTTYLNYYGAILMESKEYDKAEQTFEKSLEIDPNQVDPRISINEINSLKGVSSEESQMYRKSLLKHFPNIGPRISQGVVEAYDMTQYGEVPGEVSAHIDFNQNNDLGATDLQSILKKYPGDLSVQLRLARVQAEEKKFPEAFKNLDQIEYAKFNGSENTSTVSIPALLYHRVTLQPGEGVLTSSLFEDQLKALKKAGYVSISMQDLDEFYKQKTKLPEHPILITFDDAIKEVLTYADPILKKYDFKATMFIPTHVIENKKSFFMNWDELIEMYNTGRWDMQCHSNYGHEPITIDSHGHTGRFLVNRKWIEDQKRLETEDEFAQRVKNDYVTCKQILQTKFKDLNVIAYSYPYGDFGTESSTNSKQDVAELNLSAVKKNYPLSFIQRFPGFNIASTPPSLSMRINVNESWSGEDLIAHLKTKDPIVQAKLARVAILVKKGDQKTAIKMAEQENLQKIDPKTYYKTLSSAYEEMGNSIEAIRALDQMGISDHNNQFHRAELSSNLAPEVQVAVESIHDNSSRSLWKPSAHTRSYLLDHFFARALYEHGFYREDRPSAPVNERKAQSDSFGLGLEYYWDDLTQASLIGGFQQFDTELLAYFVDGDVTLPIINRYLSVIGHVNHQVIELSRAIHNEISQNSLRGGFTGKPTDSFYYKLTYEHKWFSDENTSKRIAARTRYGFYKPLGLYVGTYFDYQDTFKISPYYFSPQLLNQGLGEIGSRLSWNKYFRTNISGRFGAGESDSTPLQFVQEYTLDTEFTIGKNTSIEAELEYGKQPGYSALYGTLTLSKQF